MIEAGIPDGDTAEHGSTLVVLLDEQELTLKRLRQRGSSVAMEPANRGYETCIFGPNRVRVQGPADQAAAEILTPAGSITQPNLTC